jgi:uncharacterized protein (DUF1697 family)
MSDFVVLLRGIGPATHAKMPLGQLAGCCTEAGLGTVTNVGNTGNFVIRAERDADDIEAVFTDHIAGFGLACDVFVRTRRELQMLFTAAPLAEARAARPTEVGVCFFAKTPAWPERYRQYAGPEILAMYSRHLLIDYAGDPSVSRLSVEKAIGARMTQRSWSSLLRITGKLGLG